MPPIPHIEYLEPYQRLLDGHIETDVDSAQHILDPIGVGAVGGSGTRLVAQILSLAGVAMATPINKAGDALEWPPFRAILQGEKIQGHPRFVLMANANRIFEQLLERRRRELNMRGRTGWKVPGTFHWLEDLAKYFPKMQYIHLMRNGLDMAYSGNQEQAANWGPKLGVTIDTDEAGRIKPASMLEYWLTANKSVMEKNRSCLPGRVYILRFERLCSEPGEELAALLTFLGIDYSEALLEQACGMVRPPASIGRYRGLPWKTDFSKKQLQRVEELGYFC